MLSADGSWLLHRYLVECSVPGHKDVTVPAQMDVPHLADHPVAAEALRSCLQVPLCNLPHGDLAKTPVIQASLLSLALPTCALQHSPW